MLNHLRSLVLRNEDGQTTMEYGVLASLIGVALIGILLVVGGDIRQEFVDIKDKLLAAL
jgi:Flp pilus assembly pilin Flp